MFVRSLVPSLLAAVTFALPTMPSHAEPKDVPSLKFRLSEVAAQNKSALLTYARKGCTALTALPKGLDVLEMEFRGGQTARMIPVDVKVSGEMLEVSFYTPGSSTLTTRTIKARPGSDPVWITADNVKFPISPELRPVPVKEVALSANRPANEGTTCYLARLAQDYVRPREVAEANVGTDVGR